MWKEKVTGQLLLNTLRKARTPKSDMATDGVQEAEHDMRVCSAQLMHRVCDDATGTSSISSESGTANPATMSFMTAQPPLTQTT